ncbi:hypothetical protein LCGC14_3008270, partial [marine sediment metagenome]
NYKRQLSDPGELPPGAYDMVIADLPDPSTSQLNRFYTTEFFGEVKRILTPTGVLSVSLGHYENYVSDELARLIAVTHRTLSESFDNIVIIPGGSITFVASDGPLVRDVSARIEQRGIPTLLVNRHYLKGVLTPDRIADVERAISQGAPVNRDFGPVLYYYHLLRWMSRFRVHYGVLAAVVGVLTAAYLFRIRPVPLAIFTTGFMVSVVVVLMLAFQVYFGSVYHKLGLIVTVFMLGLAVGSAWMNRTLQRRRRADLAKLELFLAAFAAAMPAGLIAVGHLQAGPVGQVAAQGALALLAFLLAVLVGMEFPLAAKEDFAGVTPTAGRIYTADFVGACLGALLVIAYAFFIPNKFDHQSNALLFW